MNEWTNLIKTSPATSNVLTTETKKSGLPTVRYLMEYIKNRRNDDKVKEDFPVCVPLGNKMSNDGVMRITMIHWFKPGYGSGHRQCC